jgi:hypothetical protein
MVKKVKSLSAILLPGFRAQQEPAVSASSADAYAQISG